MKSSKAFKLEMRRVLPGQQSQVFDAWTNPETLKKWFRSDAKWKIPCVETKVEVGGEYRFDMEVESGEVYSHKGVYKEIVRPDKLVFSWVSEYCPTESQVTLLFQKVGKDKTELTLIHEFLTSEEQVKGHEWGWAGCLNQLDQVLS